jgi:hypothetical protein
VLAEGVGGWCVCWSLCVCVFVCPVSCVRVGGGSARARAHTHTHTHNTASHTLSHKYSLKVISCLGAQLCKVMTVTGYDECVLCKVMTMTDYDYDRS